MYLNDGGGGYVKYILYREIRACAGYMFLHSKRTHDHLNEVTWIMLITLFNSLKNINSGEPVKSIFGTAIEDQFDKLFNSFLIQSCPDN